MSAQNLTLLTDLYELTMMQGYFETQENQTVIFDVFFRENPNKGGYSIMAGVDQVIDYIKNLRFDEEDIAYLRSLHCFTDDFLDYLARQLDRPLAQARGVSALEEIDDRTFFSLACYDESAGQMSALVKDLLADIFSIGYKNKYLSKKLNMGSEDLLSRTLINTMCIFDNSYDKTAIKRNLENIRNFSLDGFYNFRLGDVKKKWDEIVVLSNSYDTVINDYDTMRDFLMFLLEAIPTLVNNLSVVFDEESGFELFDEKGLRLNKLTTLSVRQEPEEDLLYNLVCINPAAVNFYGDWQSMSEQFKDIADSLFVINDMKSAKIS